MKDDKVLTKLMESPVISNLGLTEDAVKSIVDAYHKSLLDSLLGDGYVALSNGMWIEVVEISNRVHVLRGVTYEGHRKYKLKLTMEDPIYKEIESYYEKLKEDLL